MLSIIWTRPRTVVWADAGTASRRCGVKVAFLASRGWAGEAREGVNDGCLGGRKISLIGWGKSREGVRRENRK